MLSTMTWGVGWRSTEGVYGMIWYGMEVVRWRMRDENDDDTGRRKTEECERSDERRIHKGKARKGR